MPARNTISKLRNLFGNVARIDAFISKMASATPQGFPLQKFGHKVVIVTQSTTLSQRSFLVTANGKHPIKEMIMC